MWYELSVALSGALVASLVSGSSGFAFGLIGSAIWLHVLPPSQVVPLVVACSTRRPRAGGRAAIVERHWIPAPD